MLSREDELKYVGELLPCSTRPGGALYGEGVFPDLPEDHEGVYSLKGVRFKALSAPGPSGARPEHLREMLNCLNKRTTRRMVGSVSKFVDIAQRGRLPTQARFILDSRLIYLRKKQGAVPRPIRVGELWRRVVAKRLLHENQADVNRVCRLARQFGVGLPGGVDVLIHFRLVLEEVMRSGNIEQAFALIDIDYKNAFPSIEWDAIREALAEDLPQLLDWCRWCHLEPSSIVLPCGDTTKCDRGAEQGDPLGPVFCAVVIARVLEKSRARLEEQGIVLADAWYMDDGQLYCDPGDADTILKTLDDESSKVGMERGRGDRAKSVCFLIGHTQAKNVVDASWYTEYIRDSCIPVPDNDLEGHILGINFDDVDSTSQQFLEASRKACGARRR